MITATQIILPFLVVVAALLGLLFLFATRAHARTIDILSQLESLAMSAKTVEEVEANLNEFYEILDKNPMGGPTVHYYHGILIGKRLLFNKEEH